MMPASPLDFASPPPRDAFEYYTTFIEPAAMAALSPPGAAPWRMHASGGALAAAAPPSRLTLQLLYDAADGDAGDAAPVELQRTVRRSGSAAARARGGFADGGACEEATLAPGFTRAVLAAMNSNNRVRARACAWRDAAFAARRARACVRAAAAAPHSSQLCAHQF